MDAHYGAYAKDYKEKDMIKNFQYLLKSGTSRNYYLILLYHFLAGMTSADFFDDIELFCMIPSSDCTLNPDIFEFMTQVRLLKNKKLPLGLKMNLQLSIFIQITRNELMI